MPTDLPFVASNPDPGTLALAIQGDSGAGAMWMVLALMACSTVLTGPAVGVLAVVVNLRKVVPPPASTLGCMGLGFTAAGLAVAALFAGMAWMAWSMSLDRAPGQLTLRKEGDGVALVRTLRDGSVSWSGRVAAPEGLAVKVDTFQTKNGRRFEARLVSKGQPIGPDRGLLLGMAATPERLEEAAAATNRELEAWAGPRP